MRIALIYLGRRGAGGPLSLALGRALVGHAELAAFLSSQQETLSAWRSAPFHHQDVPTFTHAGGLIWTLATRRRILNLAQKIRAWRPDVLLFSMVHPWNAALQAALAPIPSVVMVHDPRPHPGLVGQIVRRFEDPSLQRAARCMVFSHNLIADLYGRGVPAGNISVAPHGILDYTGGKALAYDHPHNILFFGRITAYKGIGILLPAFEQVQRQFPQARLILAGSGSLQPYQNALRRLDGVELINRWIGEEEIQPIFERAGIVVLPYTSASQSGVLPIAASFGLPVIATRTGGLEEQLLDEKTGLLVPPGDENALAGAMLRLLRDASLARRLGAALREDYLSAHSWEQAAESVLRACRAALGEVTDL